MTTQLVEYGQDPPDVTMRTLSAEGKPFCFEGKELYIQVASQVPVYYGDKVLAVSYHVINDVDYEASVEVFTVTKHPDEEGWGMQAIRRTGDTQSFWEIPEKCFKILNPEVLAQ